MALRKTYTVKKVSDFPVLSRGVSLAKLSLGRNNLIISHQGEFLVSDITAGDGNIDNLFLQCTY